MSDPQTKLGLIILAVEDLPRAVGFYRQVFGWKQLVEVPVYVEFQLPSAMRLGLYLRTGFGVNTGQVPIAVPRGALAPAELYFYPDDLAGAISRLEAAGARGLSPLARRDWGDDAAYFADPDGNVVVVARPSS